MFELIYKAGKSLADSFFIGKSGDQELKISAAEVLPLDVQSKIVTAEAEIDKQNAIAEEKKDIKNLENAADAIEEVKKSEEGEIKEMQASKNIPSPEFIAKKIAEVCQDFVGFEQFCKEASVQHAEMVKKASLKKEAAVSDDIEISFKQEEKVKPAKVADETLVSVNEKEVKSDEKSGIKDGKEQASGVKSYFAKLPNKGIQEPEVSINVQSSLKEQYKKLSAAFEDLQKKNENTEKELGKANEELGKAKKENEEMKGEITMNDNKKTIDSIVAEIKKIVKVQKENVFVDKLVKLDDKSLKIVLDVVKEIGKLKTEDKADKDVANLFEDNKPADKKEDKGFDFGKAAAKKMPGENIGQIFSSYSNANISSISDLFED